MSIHAKENSSMNIKRCRKTPDCNSDRDEEITTTKGKCHNMHSAFCNGPMSMQTGQPALLRKMTMTKGRDS
jgi:hypothetical protein